jgi:hypothetical protein
LIQLFGFLLQVAVALFQGSLPAIEPKHIVLILLESCFQVLFARDEIGVQVGTYLV